MQYIIATMTTVTYTVGLVRSESAKFANTFLKSTIYPQFVIIIVLYIKLNMYNYCITQNIFSYFKYIICNITKHST